VIVTAWDRLLEALPPFASSFQLKTFQKRYKWEVLAHAVAPFARLLWVLSIIALLHSPSLCRLVAASEAPKANAPPAVEVILPTRIPWLIKGADSSTPHQHSDCFKSHEIKRLNLSKPTSLVFTLVPSAKSSRKYRTKTIDINPEPQARPEAPGAALATALL
jgi:hypothetical protein